ncbi:tryptophan--tRNA ligase, partial [Candidatus Gottesmanbacteria bacterium]|nr:tryptophan--tRNA ligase [Candidatus Gottesmanbacteria bacterium]
MKRILSGITPSGDGTLHIGNYLGAVRQFVELANPSTGSGREPHECFLMIADLHALTTVQNREMLQKNTETLILNELALLMGDLGPTFPNITFFRQSDVPMHTELQSILNNITPVGLIKRAHAYKDKLAEYRSEDEINMGLFNYPILMAADILLYKPDLVPVGKDQKQHIEITRDIAERFNKIFSVHRGVRPSSYSRSDPKIFPLPEPYIPDEVAVVMGTDGKRKMSKSLGNIISIFEDEAVIRKQVMGTFTDPTRIHATDLGHIEGNMVFTYLEFFGESNRVAELKNLYKNGQVADVEVKNELFTTLIGYFEAARNRYQHLVTQPDEIRKILKDGADKAAAVAGKTLQEVRVAIGLTN